MVRFSTRKTDDPEVEGFNFSIFFLSLRVCFGIKRLCNVNYGVYVLSIVIRPITLRFAGCS